MFALAVDLLRWVEMLALREISLRAASGVVLVDEVDAHLHPRWEREAGFIFTRVFPRLQFIVTSHSPFVAMAARETGLTLLEKRESAVVANQDVQYVRGWAVDRILTELFGMVSLRDPDTTRKLERYEALRIKRRAGDASEDDEAELGLLEEELNERLQGEPDSPSERRFEEDLAFFAAQLRRGGGVP
jgi:hypothetical protein